jgi:cytoskeletal protein CcmA (bactofilin family)
MKAIFSTLVVLAAMAPFLVNAETVLRVGNDISLEADQVVDGDYYVSAGPLGRASMSGTVAGDMLVFASSAVLNGTIAEDLLLVAGTAQVQASTSDDVRILAGEVTLSEAVGGDVFVIGGTLNILSTATIAGDVFFFGGSMTSEGTIGGSVLGSAERVRIDGAVGKDINMQIPAGLTLGEKASVKGNVTYMSFLPMARSQASVIEGEVIEQKRSAPDARTVARELLTPLFVILFATLSLFLLFKRGLERLVATVDESLVLAVGIGAGIVLAAPVAALILMVTVLGFLLGIMLFGSLLVFYAVAVSLTGAVLAGLIMKRMYGEITVTLLPIVLGTLAVYALMFLPFIGPFMVAILFMLTLGGLVRGVYHVLKVRAE